VDTADGHPRGGLVRLLEDSASRGQTPPVAGPDPFTRAMVVGTKGFRPRLRSVAGGSDPCWGRRL